MERTDRWHLFECGECGLPFPRGLSIVARLLVCPHLAIKYNINKVGSPVEITVLTKLLQHTYKYKCMQNICKVIYLIVS